MDTDAYVRLIWDKEEEVLDMYRGTVEAILPRLGVPWKPNYQCRDAIRQFHARMIARGRQAQLVFQDAVIFHDRECRFSSIWVYLRSSSRFVIVRIHLLNGERGYHLELL